jgi:hypothetical protein
MVYLSDDANDASTKRLNVIGFNTNESHTFKTIHSMPIKVDHDEKLTSRSITSTNHLVLTFSNGSALMMYLENFRDIHFKRCSNELSPPIATNDYIMCQSNSNIRNVGLCHFTEFFLNT